MQPAQTYLNGDWHEGNIALFGVEEYASWLGMSVFDGARAFSGVFPDGDKHCQRSLRSAEALGLEHGREWEDIYQLCLEGIAKFRHGANLYVRIEFWDRSKYADVKSCCGTDAVTAAAGFAIVIEEIPLKRAGFTATMSKYRRCAADQAPTHAKASCLYPTGILAAKQAKEEGFDDAVLCSPDGKVAEFTMSNIFHVNKNTIITPEPNGSFLNGITRQTMIKLFEKAGLHVEVRPVFPAELDHADEIFSTGNASKIQPVTNYKGRDLSTDFATMGWELYWEYSQQFKI